MLCKKIHGHASFVKLSCTKADRDHKVSIQENYRLREWAIEV
jgi:hypothetical protein